MWFGVFACPANPTCSLGYTCPAGFTANTTATSAVCAAKNCTLSECCVGMRLFSVYFCFTAPRPPCIYFLRRYRVGELVTINQASLLSIGQFLVGGGYRSSAPPLPCEVNCHSCRLPPLHLYILPDLTHSLTFLGQVQTRL